MLMAKGWGTPPTKVQHSGWDRDACSHTSGATLLPLYAPLGSHSSASPSQTPCTLVAGRGGVQTASATSVFM